MSPMRCAWLLVSTDAAVFLLGELIEQEAGQRKGPEVVDPKVRLETILGVSEWRVHDAGVVDQHIQARLPSDDVGRMTNTFEVGLIERYEIEIAG